jgi:hypothetical protein
LLQRGPILLPLLPLDAQEPASGTVGGQQIGDRACTSCHERFTDEREVQAHTHHAPGSAGSECYNCHMPRTTYGVLKAIRSHQISSPRVSDELATGRPNACNLCHLDKTLAWTVEHLSSWFGQPTLDLPSSEKDVADAVRLALVGDAGQRTLLAWHIGWEDALKASGSDWITLVLARLLDDPYAAVRCLAVRSLRHSLSFPLTDYDYTQEPDSRPSIRARVLEQWLKQQSGRPLSAFPPPTLVQPGALSAMEQAFDRLTRQRDDHSVRLRELR